MVAIIDGRAIAARARERVAADVRALEDKPGLATILIGDDPASAVYVAAKRNACVEAGIESLHHHLPANAARGDVLDLIDRLNDDLAVNGILCQLPLPAHLDPDEVTNRIAPVKDVDGLTIANAGRLALGMPGLLLAANATVTACHSRTVDLREICRQADILIAAAGRPELVRGDWIQPGAIVIDVGINRTETGLVGDVAFAEAAAVASAITPVPGGVGPMTIACLLRNTVEAATATALVA